MYEFLLQFANSWLTFVRLEGFSKPYLYSAPDMTFVCGSGVLITREHKLELNWVNTTHVELRGRFKREPKSDLTPFIFFSHDQLN